jgi:signal transduction histidine kinase
MEAAMTLTPAAYPAVPAPPPRWWSLTTSGSVTALIGATCLVALASQALVRGHSLASSSVVLAALVIVALVALDRYVERRYGERLPRRLAIGVVVAHALLLEGLTLLDGLTYTAIMYLTLPFPACFLLGRRAGMALSAGVLAWFTLKYSLLKPGWFNDPQALTTFLLFVVALTLITAMAQVVQRERASRWHTETLLHNLDQAHQQLAASHTELLRASAQVAELATIAERNRLARDIHDSLGHYLTVVGVQLEKALLVADEDPPALHAALGHAKRLTDQALRDVRASVGTLRQDEAPFELVGALHQLVADLRGLPFAIDCTISGDEGRFSPQQRIALFRAAQEGLTNVQRHANALQVRLRLDLGEHAATLTLDDDGRGIADDWGAGPGVGLRGVQERLELVSGRLLVTRNLAGGTRLAVMLPRTSVSGGRGNG